ncbi:MAG: hypothetical protein P0S94_01110 [Simkaniaceae bacterium]|nr:hypothetical protein [Simkaniaceae bacterium]
MRQGDVAFSAVHLFVVTILFAFGVLLLAIASSATVRFNLSQIIFHAQGVMWQIGMIIVGTSVLLFTALFLLNKKRYLHLELEGPVSLSRPLIEELLHSFFTEKFPENTPHADVNITKAGIEVVTSLPDLSDKMLEKLESDLPVYLNTHLGRDTLCTLKLS